MSYIVPTIKMKRDAIIIHCGANDLTNDKNTIQNLQSIVNKIKSKSSCTKIAVSSVLIRNDKNGIEHKVKGLNEKLKSFCEENLIDHLSNDNIDESCLGIKNSILVVLVGRGLVYLPNRRQTKCSIINTRYIILYQRKCLFV